MLDASASRGLKPDRAQIYKAPKFADNIDVGDENVSVKERLREQQFYGVPFKKMKAVSSDQVMTKLKLLRGKPMKDLLNFYAENADMYDEACYLRTLDFINQRMRAE